MDENYEVLNTGKCYKRVTRGGEEGRSPLPIFQNLEKSILILGKNALIVVIYGLNFSFKIQFLKVFRIKYRRFFPAGSFFPIVHNCLSKCPNSKKTPLP